MSGKRITCNGSSLNIGHKRAFVLACHETSNTAKIPMDRVNMDPIAETLGLSSTPSLGTYQRWCKRLGLKSKTGDYRTHRSVSEDNIRFTIAVSEFLLENLCKKEDAIRAVSEMLEVSAINEVTVMSISRRFDIPLLNKKIECRACYKMYHPPRVWGRACPACLLKYDKNQLAMLTQHGMTEEELADLQVPYECHCGTKFIRHRRNQYICPVCVAKHKQTKDPSYVYMIVKKRVVVNCPCCGRLEYRFVGSKPNATDKLRCCKKCLTSLSNHARVRMIKKRKFGTYTSCVCGNPVLRYANPKTMEYCTRCISNLTMHKRGYWHRSSNMARCAHCYERMPTDSDSRFCTECLDQHGEKTLTRLCMTDEMKEEEEVKRYNKEFMRKHTRMINRNKPKQQQPRKGVNHKKELIDDLNEQALISSLGSLIIQEE